MGLNFETIVLFVNKSRKLTWRIDVTHISWALVVRQADDIKLKEKLCHWSKLEAIIFNRDELAWINTNAFGPNDWKTHMKIMFGFFAAMLLPKIWKKMNKSKAILCSQIISPLCVTLLACRILWCLRCITTQLSRDLTLGCLRVHLITQGAPTHLYLYSVPLICYLAMLPSIQVVVNIPQQVVQCTLLCQIDICS